MKRLFTIALAAIMALTASAALPASAATSGDWECGFSTGDRTATIIRYVGSATEVTIPSEIDGHRVTTLADQAFADNDSLTSVTIPDSVIRIDGYTFYGCSSLASLKIGNSLTTIGVGTFYHCTSLTSVTLPDSLTTIENAAFFDCASLKSINIPKGLTTIEGYAFCECSSLESVTIPDTVTKIESGAFADCTSLTGIEVDPNNPCYASIDGVLFTKDINTLVACPGTKTSVTIPDSVTKIGFWAFHGCSLLKGATIPDGVTTISECAFYDCSSLASVTIPAGVTVIGENAFDLCYALKTVYYGGSTEQWNAIDIKRFNSPLTYHSKRVFLGNPVTPGDLDRSGGINSKDVVALMRFLAGWEDDDTFPENADFNGDGKLNVRDVYELMRSIIE